MSATTMHFGPEWMRTKHQTPARPPPQASPPLPPPASAPASSAFTYSALVSPAPETQPIKRDEVHPFRYSKEEMLRIYKEGGGKGGLGLEVERWEGVIRELEMEPVAMREMSDAERKLFAGPLNSELRRRQSADLLSPLITQTTGGDRPRLNHTNSGTGSPLRERFGGLMGKRRDSTDQPSPTIPRKLSLSSNQVPQLGSARDTAVSSPRPRMGGGFDGVLNSGDSWVARRRASEGLLKSTSHSTSRLEPNDGDPKTSDIREEDEGHSNDVGDEPDQSNGRQPLSSKPIEDATVDRSIIDSGFSNLPGQSLPVLTDEPAGIAGVPGPPPGIMDLASVEWSYLDPQGKIQGPFRADLMQKWYDDGYFVQELLMKRTHVDTEWLAVGELARRSGGDKIFLSPPAPPLPPPGLGQRTESPLQGFIPSSDQGAFHQPLQPAPLRSLRTSTLESYLATGSNPSDSPSSSFGAGRFSNGSPDPAFGGRSGNPAFATGDARFNGTADLGGFPISRRNNFNNDPIDNSRSPSFSNLAPGRTSSVDNYNTFSSTQGPWQGNSHFDGANIGRSSADIPYIANNFNSSAGSTVSGGFNNFVENGNGNFGTNYNGGVNGIPFSNSPQNLQYTHYAQQPASPLLSNVFSATTPSKPSMLATHNMQVPSSTAPQSPWKTSDVTPSPVRRPGPFDPSHPTTNNTQPVTPLPASPWARHAAAAAQPAAEEPSPWLAASQGVVTDSWTEAPGPNSLTFDNVGQHNQPHPVPPNHVVEKQPLTAVAPPIEVVPVAPVTKPRKAGATKPVPVPAASPKPAVAVASPSPPPPAPPQSASKAAWANEEENKKSKPSGASLSLRDIQDAEAKKMEARKVAERERERASRAASTPITDDSAAPFTASWGLPTSQAGGRGNAPVKEATSPSVNATSAPVWTTGAKPPTAKKTMKEIQEEEERRKKAVAKETTAAAARRAYAETTNKAAPPPPGSAWTTVGPSGKGATAVTTAVRPPAASVASTSAVRVNGSSAARSQPTPVPVKAPQPVKVDDHPVVPSHDFLKWLNDSLKGLNTSVNVEEIMSMLLSFPMDPDSSTAEIISDLIYANSTTLDGRRFASEFVSRRKTDATSRPKGIGITGNVAGKPVSIADVVKSQPKPSQPEWGGFKVVNKKKKGGRS